MILRLLDKNPESRLGAITIDPSDDSVLPGATFVKEHEFFDLTIDDEGFIDFDALLQDKACFVPVIEDELSNSYFDDRSDRYSHKLSSSDSDLSDGDSSLSSEVSSPFQRFDRVNPSALAMSPRSKGSALFHMSPVLPDESSVFTSNSPQLEPIGSGHSSPSLGLQNLASAAIARGSTPPAMEAMQRSLDSPRGTPLLSPVASSPTYSPTQSPKLDRKRATTISTADAASQMNMSSKMIPVERPPSPIHVSGVCIRRRRTNSPSIRIQRPERGTRSARSSGGLDVDSDGFDDRETFETINNRPRSATTASYQQSESDRFESESDSGTQRQPAYSRMLSDDQDSLAVRGRSPIPRSPTALRHSLRCPSPLSTVAQLDLAKPVVLVSDTDALSNLEPAIELPMVPGRLSSLPVTPMTERSRSAMDGLIPAPLESPPLNELIQKRLQRQGSRRHSRRSKPAQPPCALGCEQCKTVTIEWDPLTGYGFSIRCEPVGNRVPLPFYCLEVLITEFS